MKQYIRTKDGKIIDTEPFYILPRSNGLTWSKYQTTVLRLEQDIRIGNAKEVDTIEELIEVGDLYFYNINLTDRKVENQFDILGLTFDKDIMLAKLKARQIELTKLYTKQGDNYILVWDKERRII